VCAQGANPRGIDGYTWPSEAFSLGPGVPEASFYALRDQAPFEFGDGAEDRKNHLAGRRRCIHLLRKRNEFDAK
jgi:hypothetical protein